MRITPFAVANEAIERVANALSKIEVPFSPHFLYTGFRGAQYTPQSRFKRAFANVLVSIRTPIDYTLRIEVPVPVVEDRVLDPQVFIHGGKIYPLEKEALSNLLFGAEQRTMKLMHMFNDPRVISFPEFNQGMFSTEGIPIRRLEGYPGSLNWAMGAGGFADAAWA